MLVQKRSLAAIVATAALVVAALTFAAPTRAAPYVTAPTLAISTTAPCPGDSLTVTGSGFVPGSTVELTLHSAPTSLGSVVVNAAGGFTMTVRVPTDANPGSHQLVAAGPPTSTNSNTAEATLNVRNCVAAPVSRPSIAFTGVDIFGMVAGVVVLLGIGGALVYLGRRRRAAA